MRDASDRVDHKLPLHINAELALMSDRRQPLMSTAAAARWNAEAIACAGGLLAGNLEPLADLLGPVRLWGALDNAWTLHRIESTDPGRRCPNAGR